MSSAHVKLPCAQKITCTILQHVHPDTLTTLQHLYIKILLSGQIPKFWTEAIVLAFLKEGKDPSSSTGYRPVVLTSCLCKPPEKMINRRLAYLLEYNGLLESCQAVFMAGRYTNDQTVALESYNKDAYLHRQYCITVLFDLLKVYRTAWR